MIYVHMLLQKNINKMAACISAGCALYAAIAGTDTAGGW